MSDVLLEDGVLRYLNLLLLTCMINATYAQQPNDGMMQGMSAADCDALATMPNAPISVQACQAMMGMGENLTRSAADTSAHRPNDAALTCEQIMAELQTMEGVGVSDATAAQSEAAINEATAVAAKDSGEITAFMAETQALGAAAAGASLLGPVGSYIAGAALSGIVIAKQMALAKKAQANQAAVREKMDPVVIASARDMNESMQSNPRFARLMQLGIQKNCRMPEMEGQ